MPGKVPDFAKAANAGQPAVTTSEPADPTNPLASGIDTDTAPPDVQTGIKADQLEAMPEGAGPQPGDTTESADTSAELPGPDPEAVAAGNIGGELKVNPTSIAHGIAHDAALDDNIRDLTGAPGDENDPEALTTDPQKNAGLADLGESETESASDDDTDDPDSPDAGELSGIPEGLTLSSTRAHVWATWTNAELAEEIRSWQVIKGFPESNSLSLKRAGMSRAGMLKLLDDMEVHAVADKRRFNAEPPRWEDYREYAGAGGRLGGEFLDPAVDSIEQS